ncbi:2-phosphosulfolactate phosphatase [Fontivita pretiosa]|uniref:2-phosphosulfolactate phosphatase n=1 Tax=Fontivita pretiosa TaxID=2989684 RepID=UPI003D17F17C
MIRVDVVPLPTELQPQHIAERAVVVFDVLRATTTIVSALAAGAREVRVFDSLEAARNAARCFDGPKLLCGEQRCLPPDGFDLGNSPGQFTADRVGGRTIFLSTTNGTRAIVAARGAARLFVAGLVNATATARALVRESPDVTLLCAGTNGQPAVEDLIGAGAVASALEQFGIVEHSSNTARQAIRLFRDSRDRLAEVLRNTLGGQNIRSVGLDADIDFAARIDAFDLVAQVIGDPPLVRAITKNPSD